MYKPNTLTIFVILYIFISLLLNGIFPNNFFIFAQNEDEIKVDIEQENKCEKDGECKSKNEINSSIKVIGKSIQYPELQSSLTVKKEIFGCENITRNDDFDDMVCIKLGNNSDLWLQCTDSKISNTAFCENLPKRFFDIEILDGQNNQIRQFKDASRQGTVKNINPGIYIINQIKYQTSINELGVSNTAIQDCKSAGFSDGGILFNQKKPTQYSICIEYEDEFGNDCSIVTIDKGEKEVCIVKNHIVYAAW